MVFRLLQDRNAAQTGFLTKYSEGDLMVHLRPSPLCIRLTTLINTLGLFGAVTQILIN